MNPAQRPCASRLFAADCDVIAELGLAATVGPRPFFSDDFWDFSAVSGIPVANRTDSQLTFDWACIVNPRFRTFAKEVAMIQMQPMLAHRWHLADSRRIALKPQWMSRSARIWARWLNWLSARDVSDLALVTQVHCDAYLAGIADRGHEPDPRLPTSYLRVPGPAGLSAIIDRLRDLADSSCLESASHYRPGFRPWNKQPSSKITGYGPKGENATRIVPDDELAPILAAALFVVNVIGPDILQARRQTRPIRGASVMHRDGQEAPWRSKLSRDEAVALESYVLTACLIVIAALSGMRAGEIMELRRGCVHREDRGNGLIRFRLKGHVTKGQALGGQPETWTVVLEVADAAHLAETLEVAGIDAGSDYLFGRVSFDRRLRSFSRWVDRDLSGVLASIRSFPSLRSFRRTLARTLAFRPHGVLAGKVHLKHLHVATSEGYYGRRGSSAAQFLAEVERERAEAQIGQTKELYRSWEGGAKMGGPGARSLERFFEDVANDMGSFTGTVMESNRRLELLLRKRSDTLHVGPLNNCWFTDPKSARCLILAKRTESPRPLLGMCEPTQCGSSTLHTQHRPVWAQTLVEVDELRRSARVPKHERHRLDQERDRITKVLAGIPTGASE